MAYVKERRCVYRALVGNLRERERLKDLDVDGRVSKLNLNKTGGGREAWMDWSSSGQGQVEGSREDDNEPSVSIKCRKCFD